ncbi:unnamed protein product [Mesocestoides corti]|uniref:Uncharacterized protein n=1 Tax=Mesocestoides corti TaxID=53468 RepID=A0A0R3UQW9_MESCO|nr:unnamed protein product [Mesocestoides corti]
MLSFCFPCCLLPLLPLKAIIGDLFDVLTIYSPSLRGLVLLFLLLLLSPTFYFPPLHFLHLLIPPVQSVPLQAVMPEEARAVVVEALEHSQSINRPQEVVSVSKNKTTRIALDRTPTTELINVQLLVVCRLTEAQYPPRRLMLRLSVPKLTFTTPSHTIPSSHCGVPPNLPSS